LRIPETNFVFIVDDKFVGSDNGLAKYLPTFIEIMGIDIGKGLKDGQRNNNFSNTADVLG
jgi:hypothetical protein